MGEFPRMYKDDEFGKWLFDQTNPPKPSAEDVKAARKNSEKERNQ